MSKRSLLLWGLLVGMLTIGGAIPQPAQADDGEYVLTVLDPRSQFWGPLAQPLSPRVDSVDGKRVAII